MRGMNKLLLYFGILASSLCFFAIFALFGLNGTLATCTLQQDGTYTCKVQTVFLNSIPLPGREIEGITGAETESDGCFEGCAYRTEFITEHGSVPLSETYTDEFVVDPQTAEINALIQSGQAHFEYKRDPLWWLFLLVVGLGLMEFVIVTVTVGIPGLRDYLKSRKNSQLNSLP
jgi:hypothetical protein